MTVERQPHAVLDLPSRRWKGEKILRLLALAPRATPWRVLEVGTGTGGIAHYLATHATIRCEVTSVDVVDVRRVHDGYRFLRVDGTTLPFADAAFDVVISNHVIEHVGDREAQRAHLRECRRVLAAEGRGYLAVPNRWMLVEPHYRLAFLSWLPHGWRSPYLRLARKGRFYDCEPLTVGELEAMFAGAGLAASNLCLQALRATFAIEGARSPAQRCAARLPDAVWRRLLRVFPTLVYGFGRAPADAARALPAR
ncbi:MAG: class I SAM-dependent methyltransferase [Lysobacteraceae bacterium]